MGGFTFIRWSGDRLLGMRRGVELLETDKDAYAPFSVANVRLVGFLGV